MPFDGSNMWGANAADNTVSKLQATNEANLGLGTVAVGTNPHAIDGTNVWAQFGREYRYQASGERRLQPKLRFT
jgi:hypothetical protein